MSGELTDFPVRFSMSDYRICEGTSGSFPLGTRNMDNVEFIQIFALDVTIRDGERGKQMNCTV